MDAIILAGGKGTRMEDKLPKPLLQADGKPILFHQIDYLNDKVNKIVVSIGYMANTIKQMTDYRYLQSGKILYAIEENPAGTAGGLKNALKRLAPLSRLEYAVVLNCDDLANIDINELKNLKENTLCVAHPRLPYSRVVKKYGKVLYEPYPVSDDWVSCGWYVLNKKKIMNRLPDKGSLEHDVFPNAGINNLYEHKRFWRALNTKKDIEEFEKNQEARYLNL